VIFRSYVSLPEGRSHRQLSIVIQQTSIFGYLCAVCRQSWRHWNLGNSYFLGWWIHTSTCTSCTSDKPCKIHLQNQDHLSYQILPYPTISYHILPDPTNISWTLQKPVAPIQKTTTYLGRRSMVDFLAVWTNRSTKKYLPGIFVMNTMIQWVSDKIHTLW
jgi:hypothetical protein